jgi:hypothetical protein
MLKVNSQNYFSNQTDYKPITVTFLLTGNPIENFAREVLKMLGISTESEINGYNAFYKTDIVKHFISELGEAEPVVAQAKKQRKLSLNQTVYVATEIIDNIKNYLANPNAVPPKSVSEMANDEKLIEVIKRAALLLPANIGQELLALLDPTTLAIVVAVVVAWAVSHFFGIGEIADVIMLIVGVVSLGPIAWKAGEHLISFANFTINGKTDKDLNEAAKHLSQAIALIGVQVVMALLLKKAPKVFNEPASRMNKSAIPFTMKTIGEPPITKSSFFYKSKTTFSKHQFLGRDAGGGTNQWGDTLLSYGKNIDPTELEIAKFHEMFHSSLTPKLQMFRSLRQIRAVLKTNSYLKSYLLRYLEESLAQTIGLFRAKGINIGNLVEGFKFPVGEEGYVTVVKMGVEATGILLGPINVSGMTFNVYFSFTKDW